MTSLQGLNIVEPVSNDSRLDSESLLPDLAAQLDLWTTLAFDGGDEPASALHDDYDKPGNDKMKRLGFPEIDEEIDDEDLPEGPATHEHHDNIVHGTTLPPAPDNIAPPSDVSNFLAGFALESLLGPQQPSHQESITPSLAQLLASVPQVPSSEGTITPSLAQLLAAHTSSSPSNLQLPQSTLPSSQEEGPPPAKRSRTRKRSLSIVPDFTDEPNTTTPLSASEDKRRRNTAASARFRLKKKEREAALEQKLIGLEGRVNELERECEGLRRENGWLKGLVVGVTGGAPTGQTTTAMVSAGVKRSRKDTDVN